MKIAYFGIKGSYSYMAARGFFGNDTEMTGAKKFADVFELVGSGEVDSGLVPIENSLAGSVYENYDLLSKSELKITGEYYLRIRHCLLGLGSTVRELKKIFAHPQALAQCSQFFEKNPWIEKEPYGDNASAAAFVSERGNVTYGAIAGEEAASLYGLEIVERNIADDDFNITRFIALSKKPLSEGNKCSVLFTVSHTPGSLYKALELFHDSGVNLTKIESRPVKGSPFEYMFYVDFVMNGQNREKMLEDLNGKVHSLKVLGVYSDASDTI